MRPTTIIEKSTIVRFSVRLRALPALTLALVGCASAPTLATDPRPCAAASHAVCSSFGPQKQCACAPQGDIEQFLAGFGEAAWPGGRH
jgi:hypothetical protein